MSGVFWKQTYSNEVSPDLTEQEKLLRDQFAAEYLIDYDPHAAALRVGFTDQYAHQYAAQFMQESYTRKKITELQAKPIIEDEKEHAAQTQNQVLSALWREANYRGPGASHGSRVAALAKLASLHGMDQPTKVQQTIEHRGGVMAVPGIASAEMWEQQAMQSQEKLTSEATT